MARPVVPGAPDGVVQQTSRDVLFGDAITGTDVALEGATTLRSLLLFLESQCASSPVQENQHLGLDERLQAALVIGWDALCSVEVGAAQARELIQKLQAQEPAVTR